MSDPLANNHLCGPPNPYHAVLEALRQGGDDKLFDDSEGERYADCSQGGLEEPVQFTYPCFFSNSSASLYWLASDLFPAWHEYLSPSISDFDGGPLYPYWSLRTPSEKPAGEAPNEQDDQAKSAHSRRREQVRRAQRNYREKKEKYIKSLEQELLRLRDETTSVQTETYQVVEENSILRDIMLDHGIPLPGLEKLWMSHNPMATVSVIGSPGYGQRLQVSMNDDPAHPLAVFPRGFGVPDGPDGIHPIVSVVVDRTSPTPPEIIQQYLSPPAEFNPRTSPQPTQVLTHPYGLDATQVGVDFVLFMERCCLYHVHVPDYFEEATGHAMTVLAPMLTGAPPLLNDYTSWQIPAKELDRLFSLSSSLHLDGELTPVQIWMRVKQHQHFHKLKPEHVRKLGKDLIGNVRCYGFGAVIEEKIVTRIMNELFDSL
ncbi:hypothetical protein GX48_00909 [Paracoccidioides brasiliensis]|nr:hypothetical protein GX48_00909 [Paracoccidioides brasiliensis]